MKKPIAIAHRGNTKGAFPEMENKPEYIDAVLLRGFHAEIDLRVIDGKLFLGHDTPDYEISLDWLMFRKFQLWIHCKNFEALQLLGNTDLNYFWHENDAYTITSLGFGWVYPGNPIYENSVMVMVDKIPEVLNCYAICLDDFSSRTDLIPVPKTATYTLQV
jgi:hypothetical protein